MNPSDFFGSEPELPLEDLDKSVVLLSEIILPMVHNMMPNHPDFKTVDEQALVDKVFNDRELVEHILAFATMHTVNDAIFCGMDDACAIVHQMIEEYKVAIAKHN